MHIAIRLDSSVLSWNLLIMLDIKMIVRTRLLNQQGPIKIVHENGLFSKQFLSANLFITVEETCYGTVASTYIY